MSETITLATDLQFKNYSLIFLGGIHGVGKTYFCQNSLSQSGYKCVTASSLIRKHKEQSDLNKRVKSIADNQLALLHQLEKERHSYNKLVLDGHYCLLDQESSIKKIDIEVFQQIKPDLFILLKGNLKTIADRLESRDGKEWDIQFIETFQEEEEKYAKYLSEKLHIPLKVIEVGK